MAETEVSVKKTRKKKKTPETETNIDDTQIATGIQKRTKRRARNSAQLSGVDNPNFNTNSNNSEEHDPESHSRDGNGSALPPIHGEKNSNVKPKRRKRSTARGSLHTLASAHELDNTEVSSVQMIVCLSNVVNINLRIYEYYYVRRTISWHLHKDPLLFYMDHFPTAIRLLLFW